MPTPTIPDGKLFFNATLWTGNGTSQTITNGAPGQSFQPDLVWLKERSSTSFNWLTNSVTGNTKILSSNSTDAEATETQGITAFNTNGFSVGSNNGFNENAQTYVGWQWKAGGTAVSNTDGTITSSVSANQTSGFSVVTFNSGSAGNQSFGHGLGVTPGFFVIKSRATSFWDVWHQSFSSPATNYMYLDLTNAVASDSRQWANTAPNSTVISYESGYEFAANTDFVAYCWAPIAGYSAFGSYTGNGSADGPFCYTGFQPRWLMIKVTNTTDNWYIIDSVRQTYNVIGPTLAPNLSNAEFTLTVADILSNGFKIRNSASALNGSGNTVIYAAFASNPFKYSNAF